MRARRSALGLGVLAAAGCVSRTEVFEEKAVAPAEAECSRGPLECAFPELPELRGLLATVHGDTAVLRFAGTAGARDHRVFAVSSPDAVRVTPAGRVVVRDAIHRCAGSRQFEKRPRRNSLEGDVLGLLTRDRADSTLGHVYLEPGPGRVAITRLADSAADADASFEVPAIAASRAARYVPPGPTHDALLARGYRNDGIAFYAPTAAMDTRPVFVWRSAPLPDAQGRRATLYMGDGTERAALESSEHTELFTEEFRVLLQPNEESVPLFRILYAEGHAHDVLAPGEAQRERLLVQGNAPLFELAWPGLTEGTVLVVEALDAGCPFPGHLVPEVRLGKDAAGELTLDEARLSSGEVYVGGQHEPSNRPSAIARSFVRVAPEPVAEFALSESFDDPLPWSAGTAPDAGVHEVGERFRVEASSAESHFAGAMLGQLWLGLRDDGGPGWLRVSSVLDAPLRATSFLQVSLRTNLPSTPRRHPFVALRGRTHSLVVRTRGVLHGILQPAVELRLEICEGDAPSTAACTHTDLMGRRIGDPSDARPWAPVPVLGELAGFDLPKKLEVRASTERAYLFIEDRPAGCAVLPPGLFTEQPVTVSFGMVSNDSRDDESTVDETSGHQYLLQHSVRREVRRFDDLGIEFDVAAPDWDEQLFPCGSDWRADP